MGMTRKKLRTRHAGQQQRCGTHASQSVQHVLDAGVKGALGEPLGGRLPPGVVVEQQHGGLVAQRQRLAQQLLVRALPAPLYRGNVVVRKLDDDEVRGLRDMRVMQSGLIQRTGVLHLVARSAPTRSDVRT